MKHNSSTATETNTDLHLQSWVYVLLALVFSLVGICASAVTADFFIVGLLKLEADATARNALIAAGVLMIIAEVLAFGVAGLLPRKQLGSLRRNLIAFGLALLAFEIVTIYVTQVALAQTSNVEAQSTQTRITALEQSIAGQRASATALRTNADRQTASTHSWIRVEGAKSLKAAVELEKLAAEQGVELAALQKTQRPTMTGILGHQGMVGYSVARALLISVVGIMMCAAAGALLRARRSAIAALRQAAAPSPQIHQPELLTETNAGVASNAIVAPIFAKGGFGYACIAPVVSFAAPVIAIPAHAQSVQQTQESKKDETPKIAIHPETDVDKTPVEPEQRHARAEEAVSRPAMQDTGIGNDDGTRFQRVRDAILTGEIQPSLRAIWSLAGASQRVAQRYLEAMEQAGEIERGTRGYRLIADKAHELEAELA
ncbi:hypothetical protein [Comamonas testosteroni]|uniref:hypothetical protein n=1 Tax=Comamonas testosteroni TaxID=285 RepID=UPI0026EE4F9C|nr:hypothetical protein [Comamonas testosteroni]